MNTLVDATVTEQPQNEGKQDPYWFEDYTPTILEVDAASKYESYVTEIVNLKKPMKKRHRDTSRGRVRWAGNVSIYADQEKFVISLSPGSTLLDLLFLRKEVQQVKEGYFGAFEWFPRESKKYPGETYLTRQIGYLPNLIINNPRVPHKIVVPCLEKDCEKFGDHHLQNDDDDVCHTAERFEGDYGSLVIEKYGDDDWWLFPDIGDDLTPESTSALINDLTYARASVQRLNSVSKDVDLTVWAKKALAAVVTESEPAPERLVAKASAWAFSQPELAVQGVGSIMHAIAMEAEKSALPAASAAA